MYLCKFLGGGASLKMWIKMLMFCQKSRIYSSRAVHYEKGGQGVVQFVQFVPHLNKQIPITTTSIVHIAYRQIKQILKETGRLWKIIMYSHFGISIVYVLGKISFNICLFLWKEYLHIPRGKVQKLLKIGAFIRVWDKYWEIITTGSS